jgi:hypothetical protein
MNKKTLTALGDQDRIAEQVAGVATDHRPSAVSFPWTEIGLSRTLGVNRSLLKNIRADFKRGEDWTVEGKNVLWSEKGAGRAASLIGLPIVIKDDGSPSGVEITNAPTIEMVNGNLPSCEEMEVTRYEFINPRIIEAKLPDGELVFVTVTSNKNFRKGMKIRAELRGNVWTLDGRCPRYPGRW